MEQTDINSLDGFEREVANEIEQIIMHSNKLKAFVVLSILSKVSIEGLKQIDTKNFLIELAQNRTQINNERQNLLKAQKEQTDSDMDIMERIKCDDNEITIIAEKSKLISKLTTEIETILAKRLSVNDKAPL